MLSSPSLEVDMALGFILMVSAVARLWIVGGTGDGGVEGVGKGKGLSLSQV